MSKYDVTTSSSSDLEAQFLEKAYQLPCPSDGAPESYRNLLDTDEFKRGAEVIVVKTKLNDFPNTFHERVQVLCLCMATWQSRNRRDVVSILVPLDDNGKLPLGLHEAILAWRSKLTLSVSVTLDPKAEARTYSPSFSKNEQIVSIPR